MNCYYCFLMNQLHLFKRNQNKLQVFGWQSSKYYSINSNTYNNNFTNIQVNSTDSLVLLQQLIQFNHSMYDFHQEINNMNNYSNIYQLLIQLPCNAMIDMITYEIIIYKLLNFTGNVISTTGTSNCTNTNSNSIYHIDKEYYNIFDMCMYHMRSIYQLYPNSNIWYQLIKVTSKKPNGHWQFAKKFLNKYYKYDNCNELSWKVYYHIIKSIAKADVWKEVKPMLESFQLTQQFIHLEDSNKMRLYETILYYTAKKSKYKEAIYYFNELKKLNIIPSHSCYRHIIEACSKASQHKIASTYLDELQSVYNNNV